MLPALLAPLAIPAAKALGITALGTGISSGIAQIPYLKKQAIKNAKSADQYNPATGKFRVGEEFNLGDGVKAFLGGYSKDDVLKSEKDEFKNRIEEDFGSLRNRLQNRYTKAGLRVPAGLDLQQGDNSKTYNMRLGDLRGKLTQIEELQGMLQPDQTLSSLGVTADSNIGTINNAKRRALAADPMSPQSLFLSAQKERDADRREASERRQQDLARIDAKDAENTRRFELNRNDQLNQRRDDLLRQQQMFDFQLKQYNDTLDREDRRERREDRRLTGQAVSAAIQGLGAFF